MKFLTCNDGPNIQYEKQWPYWGEACTVDQSTEKWENIWETFYIFFHNINLSEGRKKMVYISQNWIIVCYVPLFLKNPHFVPEFKILQQI